MSQEQACKNPIEDQRKQALEHYEELAAQYGHWSSFVANAIKAYNPDSGEQQQLTEEQRGYYLGEVKSIAKEIAVDFAWENNLDKSKGYQHFRKEFDSWLNANRYINMKLGEIPSEREPGNVVTGDDLNWYHIGWNEKSRHIREYGSLICSNCYPPNNINFKTTKEEFEKLKQFWLENVEPGQQDWDELIEKEEDYYLKSGKYEIRFLNRADLLRELSSKYLLIKKDK